MTRISVYDTDSKRIDRICDEHDITEAELIEVLLDCFTDEELDDIL